MAEIEKKQATDKKRLKGGVQPAGENRPIDKAPQADGAQDQPADSLMSVEETFEALDSLIEQLESGEGSLEDAFKYYEEGMKLIKSCNDKIDRIEKQVMVLGGEQAEEEEDVISFK